MRMLLLALWTGVRLPTSPLLGMPRLRQGVIGVSVDADRHITANNIVKFERVAVAV